MPKITKEDLDKKKADADKDNKEKTNIFINIKKATVIIIESDGTGYNQKAHEDNVKKKNKGMVSSVYSNTQKVPGKKKTIDEISKNKKK